jgi:hypothetical protein
MAASHIIANSYFLAIGLQFLTMREVSLAPWLLELKASRSP